MLICTTIVSTLRIGHYASDALRHTKARVKNNVDGKLILLSLFLFKRSLHELPSPNKTLKQKINSDTLYLRVLLYFNPIHIRGGGKFS